MAVITANTVVNLITTVLIFFNGPTGVNLYVTYFLHSATNNLNLRTTGTIRCVHPRVDNLILNTLNTTCLRKRFSPGNNDSPLAHFMLNFFTVVNYLVFLKYPFEVLLHVTNNSLGTIITLINFTTNVCTNVFFLGQNCDLGHACGVAITRNDVVSIVTIMLLILLITTPTFVRFAGTNNNPNTGRTTITIDLVTTITINCLARHAHFYVVTNVHSFVLFERAGVL